VTEFAEGEWREIQFYDLRRDDWIAVVTRVTNDAPEPDETADSVLHVVIDDDDIIYRWYPKEENDGSRSEG
jgi:hypothetical protein